MSVSATRKAQTLLPRLESDLLPALLAACDGGVAADRAALAATRLRSRW